MADDDTTTTYTPGPHYKELGELIHRLNPYADSMEFNCFPTPGSTPDVTKLPNFQVEVDNYEGEWAFKGSQQKVKRAIRITYRYKPKSKDGKTSEVWLTEHLLVGYAGGNGS